MKTLVTCLNCNFLADELTVDRSIDPSIYPSIHPSIHPYIYLSTGSHVFSLLLCLNASKFLLLIVLTLIQTICPKFRQNNCLRMQNFYFRLTCVAQKRLCVNSPVKPIETTRRGFQAIFQFPNRYNSKLTNYSFFSNARSKPFITIPISGATKSTSIFQEGRLGWTLTRPSYRLIGTHRLTRSVLE